jgi:hypothetical protein
VMHVMICVVFFNSGEFNVMDLVFLVTLMIYIFKFF